MSARKGRAMHTMKVVVSAPTESALAWVKDELTQLARKDGGVQFSFEVPPEEQDAQNGNTCPEDDLVDTRGAA